MNKVIIIGNVGRDANLKYTSGGIPVCDFSVAVGKITGSGDSRKEKTTWFKVTVWRDKAETAAQYIKKGMKICIEGEIAASAYISKDGNPTASLEITAYNYEFLSRAKSDGNDTESNSDVSGHAAVGEPVSEIPF
jgi:single-strand DNA-binding protein